jgi:hypothetical protein
MTLMELKEFINNKIMPSDFTILIDKDNKFLARQYVEALGNLTVGGINKISSIYEPIHSSLSLLTAQEDTLNVLFTNNFAEIAENYFEFENTVVVCEQVDKNIYPLVEKYIIKMPKFESWQVHDYIKVLCPALDEVEINWLIAQTNCNIERILNELDKIKLFDYKEQKQILNDIIFDPQTDLYSVDLFDIVNALVDGDLVTLFNFLKHKNYEILEPVTLANRALSSLKNIIITQNPELTPQDCGINPNYYWKLKKTYNKINLEVAQQKLKFLTEFDLKLKTSKLEMSKQDMLNYLVANMANRLI